MSDESETRVEPDHFIIEATDGTQCMVSECDWLFLVGYSWNTDCQGYLRCNNRGTWNGFETHGLHLHRFVVQLMGLKIPEGFNIDHIDRNKLDNRRPNLRVASEEMQHNNLDTQKNNTSGYPGVSFNKSRNKWVARIGENGIRKYLGAFDDPKEGSQVREAAKKERDQQEIEKVNKCLNQRPVQ